MNDKATQLLIDLLTLRKNDTVTVNKLFETYINLENKNEINDILLDHKEFQKFVDVYLMYDTYVLKKYKYILLKYVYEQLVIPLKEHGQLEKFKKVYKVKLKEYDNRDYYGIEFLSNKPKRKNDIRISTNNKTINNLIGSTLQSLIENYNSSLIVDLSVYRLILEGVIGYKIIDESTKFITVSTL